MTVVVVGTASVKLVDAVRGDEPVGQVERVADAAACVGGHVDVAVPGLAHVVDYDVDRLAWQSA